MNPQIATILFIFGIAGLFVLDYDRKEPTSAALWLPVIWLGIAGSRPISVWLGMDPGPNQLSEGSPFDRNIFSALLIAGLLVLMARGRKVLKFLKANPAIVLFITYCAVSTLWSDYSDIALKRWTKSLGDFVMILVILTDRDHVLALKRVITRIGFVIIPLSVLFIKYFPDLGRAYSPYEGTASYVGVAEDKNMLGKICLVLGLAFCWRLYEEWSGERRQRTLLALGAILTMTLWLLWVSNSMTSLSCFVFGNCILLCTRFPRVAKNRQLVHILVATLIFVSFAVLFLNVGQLVLSAIGRNPTLTGRTLLWGEVRKIPVNPLFGAGFESFWLGKRLAYLWSLHWWHPTEAHDGYLEVLLNLGWAGLLVLAIVAISGYRNILQMFARDPSAGRLRLAYFVVAVAYNYTESAIRTLDPVWFIFILSVFAIPTIRKVVVPEPPINDFAFADLQLREVASESI